MPYLWGMMALIPSTFIATWCKNNQAKHTRGFCKYFSTITI